jgi:hypothetical protein
MRVFGPYLLHDVLVSSIFLPYLSPALSFLSCLSLSPAPRHGAEVLGIAIAFVGQLGSVEIAARRCCALALWSSPAPRRPGAAPSLSPSAPVPPHPGAALPRRCPVHHGVRPAPVLPRRYPHPPRRHPASALPCTSWGRARPGASLPQGLPHPSAALSAVGSGPPRRSPCSRSIGKGPVIALPDSCSWFVYWEGSCDTTSMLPFETIFFPKRSLV